MINQTRDKLRKKFSGLKYILDYKRWEKIWKSKTNPKRITGLGSKIDNATQKINQEIYKRNRQAPIQLKLDDLAIFVNHKITRRGIAKGLISVQEDLNKNILEAEKNAKRDGEFWHIFAKKWTKGWTFFQNNAKEPLDENLSPSALTCPLV